MAAGAGAVVHHARGAEAPDDVVVDLRPVRGHVTFLAQAPSPDRLAAFTLPKSGRDALVVDGREVYVHTPDGYAQTKLTGAFLERHLSVVSTTRNWNTVTKLCDLVQA